MDLSRDLSLRAITLGSAPPERAERAQTGWDELRDAGRTQGTFVHNREAVRALQRQLVFLGYTTGAGPSSGATIDGHFGPGTERAVHTFQREHRLAVGNFDRRTAQSLVQAVAERAAQLPAATLAQHTAILDGNLDRRTHLGIDHRSHLEAAAQGDGKEPIIPAKFLYALVQQESTGGTFSRPRWEGSFAGSLGAMQRELQGHRPTLDNLDPERNQVQIDELFERAGASSRRLPGVLARMAGDKPESRAKLEAMRTFAAFEPGQLRELSTTFGYGQIAGFQTLDRHWQKQAGRSGPQLLQALQSPDPKVQLDTLASFVRHGEDARGRHGGLLIAMQSGNCERIAASHNGAAWRTYNPGYALNLERFAREYEQSEPDRSPGAAVGLSTKDPFAEARQSAYARSRAQLFDTPAPRVPRSVEPPAPSL
ncbi:MAG: peptidoglycan-binding protein [Aphanocapsa lilacina HA4352-LM1]|jgi:peptidoglycan hydrolase-like protein with peptidoglycan-binding domain|nr:peptidoglycan-binding protein [Aphanocapsa lilacina HA4352-LM1]